MGAFNVLEARAKCPTCGKTGSFEIQFKYGDTWQHRYQINDALRWGGNDIGVETAKRVMVEGIGGPCQYCGSDNLQFNLSVESNRITRVEPAAAQHAGPSGQGFTILE